MVHSLHHLDPERFQDAERIGAGNHATVFGAWDSELERRVAIKVPAHDALLDIFDGERLVELGIADGLQQLIEELGTEAGHRYTLLREAKLLARVDHPHVVPILEVGLLDDAPAVVMPLLSGESLAEHSFDTGEDADWRKILAIAIEIGSGLEALHGAGILHRDFKPNNVLFDGHGRAQIADLGLACHLSDEAAMADWPGTPAYMAPETLAQSFRDQRDDLYAYCIVVFQMFYGHMPFASREARVSGQVSKIERPDVPEDILVILSAGLAPAAAQRWQDMGTLLDQLRRVEAGADRARRRWPWFASGAAAAAIFGALASSPIVHADACEQVQDELAHVWSATLETEMSGALDSHRTAAALGAWVTDYLNARARECEIAKANDQALTPSPCMLIMQQTFATTIDTLRNRGMREGFDLDAVVRELPRPELCLDTPRDLGVASTGLLELRTLDTKIRTLVQLGDLASARESVRALQTASRAQNTAYFLARSGYWSGRITRLEGDFKAAQAALEAAYAQAGSLGDRFLIADIALELTAIAAIKGQPRAADAYARTAMPIFSRQPARVAELLEFQGLALLSGEVRDQLDGLDLLREALSARETDHRHFGGSARAVSVTLGYLARALLVLDRADEALDRANVGLELYATEVGRGQDAHTRELHHLMTVALLRLGRASEATRMIDNILEPAVVRGDRDLILTELAWLEDVYQREFGALDPDAVAAVLSRLTHLSEAGAE